MLLLQLSKNSSSSSHPKNELLACPKNETECKICVSASCVGCGSIPNKVSLALGNDQIFRTRDGLYDHLKTLDVSVAALPDESAINFKPLDVRDFKKALEQESKHVGISCADGSAKTLSRAGKV